MKVICSCLFIAAAFVFACFSQEPKPTATPRPADDDVVKISTNLIQVDVTVTDSKGKIVPGLKPEDFEIYENGEKQKISNFSFVFAGPPVAETKKQDQAKPKEEIPVPTVELRPEKVRRTIALVVDDLSLSFESTYQVRRALKKFVDEQMQDGDLVAIIRTGAGIGALQQFTSDKRQLYAAIDKVKWNPIGNGRIGAFAPIEPTPLEQRQAAGDTTITDDDLQNERNSTNSQSDFRSSVFATGTLGALKFIVTGMTELPGRKSVILLSEGFRLMERDESGNSSSGRVLDFLRDLVDVANRSSVVFYTIDARGLQTLGFTAEDQIVDTSPAAMDQKMSDRRDEMFETQSGLQYLAAETGGFAVINNNDIAGGVRRVINDQSYYLIGYSPDSETFDPAKRRFNKLEVRVDRKDVHVRYRSGFFNIADRETATAPSGAATPVEQLRSALMSPFSVNGLSLHLNALFASSEKEGSFVRSLIHVPARDLKFVDQPDGSKKAVFEVLAASFGDNGQVIDQIGKAYTLTAKDDVYRQLMADGFVYHFAFPVKKPGAYQYRVAIRDAQSGAVGSASQFIEVPNLKKNQLTLSSLVLERMSVEDWEKQASQQVPVSSTSLKDTALRQIRSGSILRYGFEVYNARPAASGTPDLTVKVRLISESKVVFDGRSQAVPATTIRDPKHVAFAGGISIGTQLPSGDYILQVIVTDNSAPEKKRVATQYVQLEITP